MKVLVNFDGKPKTRQMYSECDALLVYREIEINQLTQLHFPKESMYQRFSDAPRPAVIALELKAISKKQLIIIYHC